MRDDCLKSNISNYDFLVNQLLHGCTLQAESVLGMIQLIADFTYYHHPGRFADGALENRAFEIGAGLETHTRRVESIDASPVQSGEIPDSRRRVLHLVTTVMGIGGHMRTIQNWAANDPNSRHSLVVTNQMGPRIPDWLLEPIALSGGWLRCLPAQAPLLAKARWLREIARSEADLVVLHHSGSDIVPTVAFATPDCPPVAVLNHADHLFWLGSTVADLVINLRSIGARLSERRRFVERNTTLPIPLSIPDELTPRDVARSQLGIPIDQTVLLTVGRAEKYRPSATHNFFATTYKILEHYVNTHLYLIGVSRSDAVRFSRDQVHPRLHPMGPIEDPSIYRASADLYVEGFPFGSQTALLESALAGLPVVAAFNPSLDLVVASDDAIADLITNPASESHFIDRVSELISDGAKRHLLGTRLRERMMAHHMGVGWNQRLQEVYEEAFALKHEPHAIPTSEPSASETDVALSSWQAALMGGTSGEHETSESIRESLSDFAHTVRQAGDYRAAFDVLVRCCQRWTGNRKLYWSLAKLPPHWAMKSRRVSSLTGAT